MTLFGITTKVAALDDDPMWLKYVEAKYSERPKTKITTFLYPDSYQSFLDKANRYDILLVDHRLGGTNGANVVRNLFKEGYQGNMFVVTANHNPEYQNFSFYHSKSDIIENPELIFEVKGSKIDMAVESSVLAYTENNYA
jgi:DNA-binding response OmpR family regulator